jgi:hypothetical protein
VAAEPEPPAEEAVVVASGTTPDQRDDRAAERDERADRRDAVSLGRDELADERDVASARRDLDARHRIEHLVDRIHAARAELRGHLLRMEATEQDPERRRVLALDRAAIGGLLDDVLDELHRGRQLRQATDRDRTDAATDRHASATDRSAATDDRFAALEDRQQSAIEREQAARDGG